MVERSSAIDPAILVGGFVIAGWGQREISLSREAEQRSVEAESQRRLRRSAGFQTIASVAATLSGVLAVLAQRWFPSLGLMAIVLLGLGLFTAFNSCRDLSRLLHGNTPRSLTLLLSASTFGIVGAFLAAHGITHSFLIFALGIGMCLAAYSIFIRLPGANEVLKKAVS